MKFKKIIAVLLSVVTAAACFTTVGCGKKEDDGLTVHVMASKGGYGVQYLKDVAAKFEEVYAEEGYKIDVMEPDPNFGTTAALNTMRMPDGSGYDIVFPGSVYIEDATSEIEGVCVEPLDDMYDQPAIGFDGQPESITLKEKAAPILNDVSARRSIVDKDGKFWAFPNTASVRGVVVNTAALEANDIDFETEQPYTSEEMFALIKKMMANGFKPMIWGGDNAATYSVSTVYCGLRQIMGEEAYREYCGLYNMYEKAGNKIPENGYEWKLQQESLQPTLEFVLKTWDQMVAMDGSYNMRHDDAHGYLMLAKAAFMYNGEYFYNEVIDNYGDKIDNVRMINFPVNSYVGMKHELCGVDHNVGYGNNKGVYCADCDKILSLMCKLYDAYKTNAEIKAAVKETFNKDLTDEQVSAVVAARGVSYGGSSSSYIIKDCGVTDIAKLFLRMLASDDASRVYASYGMTSAWLSEDVKVPDDADQFIKDCFRIGRQALSRGDTHGDPYAPGTRVGSFCLAPYNATIGKQVNDYMTIDPKGYENRNGDKTGGGAKTYADWAEEIIAKVVTPDFQKNWETWVTTTAGYSLGDKVTDWGAVYDNMEVYYGNTWGK